MGAASGAVALSDFDKLAKNLSQKNVETLLDIAVRMAQVEAQSFSGMFQFECHASQGTVATVYFNSREAISGGDKKRRVRSGGL